jgi:histidyl-tRNA synthetase
VRAAFEEVAALYNFKVMEPASLEHLSTLRAKSGTDVDKEIYAFKDKGGRDLGLRFDLTVGMTRYVCSRRDLRPPIKLAAFGGMWRYDEPQYGRFRWSHQWDLEIFGSPSVQSDAEVIDASAAILKKAGLADSTIRVGDRQVVEDFIRKRLGIKDDAMAMDLMRALDKVGKKSRSELEQEYVAKGFDKGQLSGLIELGGVRGTPEKVLARLSELGLNAASQLGELRDLLKARGIAKVEYDMSIVRGIDYYTGIVFEGTDDRNPRLGSLFGGGRYDALPKLLGRPDLSATGAAGGVEREAMSMDSVQTPSRPLVYVASASDQFHGEAIRVLAELRRAGHSSDSSQPGRSLSKQMEEASRRGAEWCVIVGEKELAAKSVTLKDMKSRKEELLPLAQALKRLKQA